jgi:hypothetical protein
MSTSVLDGHEGNWEEPSQEDKIALVRYLRAAGGADTLTFPCDREASNAAHNYRRMNIPGLEVSSTYNRVYLKLSKA